MVNTHGKCQGRGGCEPVVVVCPRAGRDGVRMAVWAWAGSAWQPWDAIRVLLNRGSLPECLSPRLGVGSDMEWRWMCASLGTSTW